MIHDKAIIVGGGGAGLYAAWRLCTNARSFTGLKRNAAREARWWLLLVALGSLGSACFEPRYPQGIPCSEVRTCPPSQSCDADGICRVSPLPAPVPDANTPPMPDARTPPTPDARTPDAAPPPPDAAPPPPDAAPPPPPVPHAASCRDHLARGATSDGIYQIDVDGVSPEPSFPVFCDMQTEGGGWTLVFKKSAGNAGDGYVLWNDGALNAGNESLLNRDPVSLDYVSLIVPAWDIFAPSEARIEVMDDGIAVRSIVFNAEGADYLSWFAPERVVESDWTDLPFEADWDGRAPGQFFSIQGSTQSEDGVAKRSWYINNNWSGCSLDRGWLMITHSNLCPWEHGDPDAEILYSAGATMGLADNPRQVLRGDAFVIFLR